MLSPLSIPELTEGIVSFLDKSDLLRLQTVSRAFNSASSVELYKDVEIDDLTAGLFHWTLQQNPSLGRLVRRLDIQRNEMMAFPREPETAGRSAALLLPYLTGLTSFTSDMADEDDLPATGIFDSLLSLQCGLSELTLLGSGASMTLRDLYPVLKRNETTLKSLNLSGINIDDEVFMPETPLKLESLQSLSTEWFEVTDEQLLALFGTSTQISKIHVALDVTGSPSSSALLTLVQQNGAQLQSLEIRQPCIGPQGGEHLFGLDMVKACQSGSLKNLMLDGQIFDKELFSLPAMRQLEHLALNWYNVIDFIDVQRWLESENAPQNLKSLHAKAHSNDSEMNSITSLDEIVTLCSNKHIKVEAGCTFDMYVGVLVMVNEFIDCQDVIAGGHL